MPQIPVCFSIISATIQSVAQLGVPDVWAGGGYTAPEAVTGEYTLTQTHVYLLAPRISGVDLEPART